METSLRLNSEERVLRLHAKENFVSDGNVALQLHASLDTATGRPRCTVQLKKKLFPELLTTLDVGARMDLENRELIYSVAGKKTWEITDSGLLCLDVKAGYQYRPQQQTGQARAVVELSQKVFNFTEDQDLKVKLGYDAVAGRPYLQLRENNWTLNAVLHGLWQGPTTGGKQVRWSVAYDL